MTTTAVGSLAAQVRGQGNGSVQTPVPEIAYEEYGPAQGFPVILLEGFPDTIHTDGGEFRAKELIQVQVPQKVSPCRMLMKNGSPRSG
jgi:hypothetical protein